MDRQTHREMLLQTYCTVGSLMENLSFLHLKNVSRHWLIANPASFYLSPPSSINSLQNLHILQPVLRLTLNSVPKMGPDRLNPITIDHLPLTPGWFKKTQVN